MNLPAAAVRRPVAVGMITLAVVTFGLLAAGRLPVRLLPDLSWPTVTIETDYPDAAPVEVETFVTRPIEEAVGVIPGVRRVRSVSRAGRSEVTLEFQWGTRIEETALDVREKLGRVELPREAEAPRVLRFDPNQEPVIRLALGGNLPLTEIRRLAERQVGPRLESIAGVAAAKVRGGLEPEVQVLVDDRRLAALGLGIADVARALRAENINRPGGRLEDRGAVFLVRTLNEFEDLDQVRRTVIRRTANGVVRVADVAEVRFGHADPEEVARVDGRTAVELDLYREGAVNTTEMAANVREALPAVRQGLPPGLHLELLSDRSRYIDRAISEVKSAALLGGLLAVLVLYFFLRDPASTGIIALAIPVSVAATFLPLLAQRVTLNIMSLGGLALGIGMLVDNAIVVLEAIDRRRREGLSRREAAAKGAGEVGGAITASTLTTVAVFLPIVFVEGVAGQLFRDLALTVCWSLLASLAVALTLVPALAALGDAGGAATARARTLFLFDRLEGPRAARAFPRPGDVLRGSGSTASRVFLFPVRLLALVLGAAGFALALPFVVAFSEERGLRARQGLPRWLAGFGWPLAARPPAERTPVEEAAWWATYPLRLLIFGLVRLLALATFGLVFGLWKAASGIFAVVTWPVLVAWKGIARAYPPLLRRALAARWAILAAAVLAFAGSLLLIPRLGTELVPDLSQGEFGVRIVFPEGTPLSVTSARVEAAERALLARDDLARVFSLCGILPGAGGSQETIGENLAQVEVALPPGTGPAEEARIAEEVRRVVERRTGAEVELTRAALLGVRPPVEVEVYGNDLDELAAAAERVRREIQRVPGVRDVTSTTQAGQPEVRVLLDHDRLARLGLDAATVGDLLRAAIRGDLVGKFRREDDRIDIRVRVAGKSRRRAEDVASLMVPTGTGTALPVSALGKIVLARGPAAIHRLAGGRMARVTAAYGGRDLGGALADIRARLAALDLPADVEARLAGQDEDMQASFRSLRLALVLALFLVYVVMASQFESLRRPLVILFTAPLGLVGVVLALWLTGTPIGVLVGIGTVLLAGIVVNNAIVLVDAVARRLREGQPLEEAIVGGGSERLRPILMTTATTVLGLLPLALGRGPGAELRVPLAVSVIGGLTVATLLTLVVIPCVLRVSERRTGAASTAPGDETP